MKKDTSNNMERCPAVSGIALNIPHSSARFPSQKDADAWPPEIMLQIDRMTDWYTDTLFVAEDPRIVPVIFPYSRFYCDVERLVNDPLEAIGQGIFYERFEEIARSWSATDRHRAMCMYHEHMAKLGAAIKDSTTLLIDCHSFPADLSDVEICIGINDDWSRPNEDTIELVLSHFRRAGYRTEINTPYMNSITPSKTFHYSSFMIEVNKSVYLNDSKSISHVKFEFLRSTIRDLYHELLGNCV